MDLEATWQEHKKFIVSVGGGALVFGLLSMGVGAVEAGADQLARRNAKENADVLHAVTGLRGQEAAEKGKKKALEEKARPAIESSVVFTIGERYLLKEDEKKNATIAYASRRALAADEVGKRADTARVAIPRKGANQPNLGFEEDTTVEGPRAAEALARCDVTRALVIAAIDAGITKIDEVRQPGATYEPLEGGAGFLRRIPVGLVFEGTTAQLAKLLGTFEEPGRFMELGVCRVTRARDSRPEEGRLTIEVELGALTGEKEAPADASATPSGEQRRPRGRRRD